MTACSQEFTETSKSSEQQGEVEISLSAVGRTQATKATTENLPDVADFTVAILTSDGIESLYENTYSNMAGRTLYLNAGDYLLHAFCGDSLGVGFDAAYFAATEPFTVEPQEKASVSTVAKLANVKVAVAFGENLRADFDTFYAIVRAREDESLELNFAQDETRAGYLPSGSLTFELWADDGGTWKYYTYDAGDYDPNDFVTFNVEYSIGDGFLSLNIDIDDETELICKDVQVPSAALPADRTKILLSGFDSDNSAPVIEGVVPDIDELRANLVAYNGFRSVTVGIESDCLSELGMPSEFDVLNLEDGMEAKLNDLGINWFFPAGSSLAYLDFAGVLPLLTDIHYDASNTTLATLTVTVTDTYGEEATSICTIRSAMPEVELSVEDYDIWGWKISGLTVNCIKADADLVGLQYKDDNGDWQDVERADASETTLATTLSTTGSVSFGEVTGLTAGNTYTFRTTYNGDTAVSSEFTVTTEDPEQIGNAGLETWDGTFTHTYTSGLLGLTRNTAYYWQPYTSGDSDTWWATNGEESMVSSVGTATSNIWHAIFQCAGPSTDTPSDESEYSAHLITVNTGKSTSGTSTSGGTTHTGELYIGTAGDSGAHGANGHAFTSRPSKISFDYKYIPYNDETFTFEAALYADESAQTLIASCSTAEGPASDEWTTYETGLDYTVTDMTAAWIYISFKASGASSPSVSESEGVTVEYDGEDLTAHAGSSLRIDNIKLIYE